MKGKQLCVLYKPTLIHLYHIVIVYFLISLIYDIFASDLI